MTAHARSNGMSNRRSFAQRLIVVVTAVLLCSPAAAPAQDAWAVTPYLSAADSPFRDLLFEYFYLEDFEQGTLAAPGVRVSSGVRILGPKGFRTRFVDSVDGDDGAIDGSGSNGHSLWSAHNTSIRFRFDQDELCGLPTHVGIVWTDTAHRAAVRLAAYDASGARVAEIAPQIQADGVKTGTVLEDTFLGVHWSEGIAEVRLSNGLLDFESDHLQFGRLCQEQPCEACQ